MLAKINNPTTALIFLLGFIWLSQYALHQQPQQGYNHSVFEVLPKTFKQRQAEALMDLWGIQTNEINQPIAIFGKE